MNTKNITMEVIKVIFEKMLKEYKLANTNKMQVK